MPSVLVIGDVITDVIARPHRQIERGTDTPADIRIVAGGSGANQAAWLAHFGIAARLAARVGIDDVERHAAELRSHGIDARLIGDGQTSTGMLVSIVDPDGERSFLTDRGANANLRPADLPAALLDGIDLVHLSGYALEDAGSRDAVRTLLDRAASRGIAYTVDPGSLALLRALGAPGFLAITHDAAICFPNALEAAFLAKRADPDDQLSVLAEHYSLVVIKRGASGAVAARGAQRVRADTETIDVLDTTGAGDAFVGAFLAAFLREEPLACCMADGVRAGTAAATRIGGRPVRR